MTAPIDWGDDQPEQPRRFIGWARQQVEQSALGRKLLDQMSDRELVQLYARAEGAEAAIARVREVVDQLDATTDYGGVVDGHYDAARRVRAALDGPKQP